ncbi:nuclear transport factor 2 family protein [Streptomyces sp. NBC_00257]|uniref:nuclear transport factor 2 family protein n=1 Tax=Streptomyces TaxID=1883 RepID=UPI00225A71DD|nr:MULTISPECIES: nuclear transport factor 2 family protein [unclassified Streptomyces]WTB57661.1 nuclear transport factor 2 family protein [Streptomyces sp. NBC_00826]WTH89456.1 nuclear transport factor 2 family protein [Streptomyces sp. NBC_00825]WTH98183.1 nuclear transport factor 2 family protein [Streptomyces sp. NBC_00822]MCX4863534.1 nuclear transport factor 2 family protein [Streptomyces sp. NBC_00906]MCX4894772.1 nuclear transport factor 2 family protein [Streptomyces sp. NBC_00892]
MTAHDEAVQRYFAAWNAATDEELAKAVAAAFTEGATYTDPLADVRGHEELAATIDGAHQQFPGFEFRLAGTPDGHHDIVRFGWELVSTADGSAPVAGFDVIALADDGRITSVSGFLDRVPGA